MKLLESYAALACAELEYAHFNALRTSVTPDGSGIVISTNDGVSVLSEPAKLFNPYYNRAVLAADFDGDVAALIDLLPPGVQAVEVLLPQQTDAVATALLEAGFVPGSSLCYLTAKPTETVTVGQRVERLTTDRCDEFLDQIERCDAPFPDGVREMKRDFYCTEKFRCYIGYTEAGEAAAIATLYISEKTKAGFFANSFTFPEHRCQGFHSALLTARMNEVVELGLDHAFTDVEPATQSHQNCERLGFRLLTANAIWKRVPTAV